MIFFSIVRSTLCPLQRLTNFQTIYLKQDVTRTYSRWTSRKPVRIVNEDELYETENTTNETLIPEPEFTPRRTKKRKRSTEFKTNTTTETTKKSPFTVLQQDDKIISSLMVKLKSRKKREKCDEIILEGRRLIEEGLKAGATLKILLFNDPSDLDTLKLPEEVKQYKIPYKTIQLWSSLVSSPGLIGIFKTPDVQDKEPAPDAVPLTIICDNVREPGNLGSIMRAAAGVGCEKLILMKGCVDLWEPKVLRSAAGAHFQLPVHAFPVWDEIPSLISDDSNIFLADSNFNNNFIPESSTIHELNTGLFNIDPEIYKAPCAVDNNDINTSTNSEPEIPTNTKMMKKFLQDLPIVPYYSLDYTKKEIVLILCGETECLNFESYKLLRERKAVRIHIPLVNEVDSLNTGVALGIITFEMKRQFLKKYSEL